VVERREVVRRVGHPVESQVGVTSALLVFRKADL
jgi:hypothetical protein